MGYDLYLKKVNTKKLEDKLQYRGLNDLSFEEFEEITEDEINSFINVFERYFTKNDIYYSYEDYFIIHKNEYESMLNFLHEQIPFIDEGTNDWDDRMALYVYNKMKEWQSQMNESTILFEHDC